MGSAIEIYYDFRSPYAYFTSRRTRSDEFSGRNLQWIWRPVSIDVLLNLQAGRDPWATYVDTLSRPKRIHLVADVLRLAAYYDLPMKSVKPKRPDAIFGWRPDPIPALCVASQLNQQDRAAFSHTIFDAFWEEQRNIGDQEVIQACLTQAGIKAKAADIAADEGARASLASATEEAYGLGVFGVPTFVFEGNVFFGNDRLDLLLWMIEGRR